MRIEKRIEKLEQKIGDDKTRIIIFRSIVSSLDDEPMLERHREAASKFIDANSQVWDTVDKAMKVLTVEVDKTGWKIITNCSESKGGF